MEFAIPVLSGFSLLVGYIGSKVLPNIFGGGTKATATFTQAAEATGAKKILVGIKAHLLAGKAAPGAEAAYQKLLADIDAEITKL